VDTIFSDPVSRTARLTAAARARESKRPDRLFEDPWAEALAGRDGVAFMERLEAAGRAPGAPGSSENPYIAIRTRFFDDFLRAATGGDGGVRQVVILAAGLDTRAFRLAWPPGVRVFELDRLDVLEAKNRLLAHGAAPERVNPRCDRRAIGVDLATEPWDEALTAAGLAVGQPSAWLVEGLFAYLDEPAARAVLQRAAALAAPRSLLGADVISRTYFTSPWTRGALEALEREHAPWRFGTDDPEGFFAAAGWTATVLRPGDAGRGFRALAVPGLPARAPGGSAKLHDHGHAAVNLSPTRCRILGPGG
jgi:methyltransferase (TIGR00027 family)